MTDEGYLHLSDTLLVRLHMLSISLLYGCIVARLPCEWGSNLSIMGYINEFMLTFFDPEG